MGWGERNDIKVKSHESNTRNKKKKKTFLETNNSYTTETQNITEKFCNIFVSQKTTSYLPSNK